MTPVAKLRIAFVLVWLVAMPVWAEPQIETLSELPADLPDWLEPLLDAQGYRVVDEGEARVELWFRHELPEREPTGEMGIEYGSLPEGALIGVMRLPESWKDYRDQPIPAGTYTLRYGVQPADGDHTGQTWFRDFLMLVPLAKDIFVADAAEPEPVAEASKDASGTAHPAVVGLYQVYDEVPEPAIVQNDLQQPMLAIVVGSMTLGLVVEGHGPELTV